MSAFSNQLLADIVANNPLVFDEELFFKNLKEILEERPAILEKVLVVFLQKREDLFKKFVYQNSQRLLLRRNGLSQLDGDRLWTHQSASIGTKFPEWIYPSLL